MSEVQTIKTAIHEIAHAKLHNRDLKKSDIDKPKDRNTEEVEAESIAYTVCQHFGIDTSDYSFGYVAGWGSGKEFPELKYHYEKGDIMEKQRLFVDMDGTLAVFSPVDTLEKLYEQGYFINQAPHENVIAAIKDIIRNNPEIEVNILSAYLTDSNYALQEKNEWLEKYLPEIPEDRRIFSPCGWDKKGFVPDGIHDTDVLLDDYTKNLLSWQPPGKGLKLLNGINHTNGTWRNDVVNFNSPTLAKDIMKIFKENELQNNITVELSPQQLKDIRSCIDCSGSQLDDLLHEKGYSFTQKELWILLTELADVSNSFYGKDDYILENGTKDEIKDEIERIRFQDSIEDLIYEFGKIHKSDIDGHKYYLLENSPMGNKSFESEKKPSIREYLIQSDPKSSEQPKEKSKQKEMEI